MGYCAALGCTNRQSKTITGITFHRFPTNEKLRQLWIKAVNREADWEPSKFSSLCSVHFPEEMMDRTSQTCVRLRENAVPSIFPNFTQYHRLRLGVGAKTAGNAHVIRIAPEGSEINRVSEQNNETVCVNEESDLSLDGESDASIEEESNESENEMSDDVSEDEMSYISKDEENDIAENKESDMDGENITEEQENNPSIEESCIAKNPDAEFVTYVVCEADQQLPNLSEAYSVTVPKNLHLKKDRSKIKDIISNVIQLESQVQAEEEVKKAERLRRLPALENKLIRLQKQRQNDVKKIKTLHQKQRRSMKTIASLKASINMLKQKQYADHVNLEILEAASFSPLLLELLKRLRYDQNRCSTKYSVEARDFIRNLYAISPAAYRYVREKLIASLPHDRTAQKWKHQTNNTNLTFKGEENVGKNNSISDCTDVQDFVDEEDAEKSFSDSEKDNLNGQEDNLEPVVKSCSLVHKSPNIYEIVHNNA